MRQHFRQMDHGRDAFSRSTFHPSGNMAFKLSDDSFVLVYMRVAELLLNAATWETGVRCSEGSELCSLRPGPAGAREGHAGQPSHSCQVAALGDLGAEEQARDPAGTWSVWLPRSTQPNPTSYRTDSQESHDRVERRLRQEEALTAELRGRVANDLPGQLSELGESLREFASGKARGVESALHESLMGKFRELDTKVTGRCK